MAQLLNAYEVKSHNHDLVDQIQELCKSASLSSMDN